MTETVRRARKKHRCDEQRTGCPRIIQPGDRYREYVVFPGDDDVAIVDTPTRMRQCSACAAKTSNPVDGAVS